MPSKKQNLEERKQEGSLLKKRVEREENEKMVIEFPESYETLKK